MSASKANRIEFLDNNTPRQEMFGSVAYQPGLFHSSASASRQELHSLTPTYQGDWNFILPKQWMLAIAPKFQYSRNKQNRFYQEGESQPIENEVKEDAYQLDWQIALGKTFARKHTVRLGSYGMDYHSRMDYAGSTVAQQDMNMLALGIPFIYKFRTQQLSLSLEAIATYQHYKVNNEAKSEWSPIIRATAEYAFNEKNAITAHVAVQRSTADGAKRNPSIMQRNEILYYCGNPRIDNNNSYTARLQYEWMPSNAFSASAFIQHRYDRNYFANIWKPYLENAILQTLENVGNLHTTNIGASLTLRLLDGNLEVNAAPELSLIKASGEYQEKASPFSFDLSASYYFGPFYFTAGYEAPQKNYNRSSVAWQRERSYYFLTAGWGNAKWKAKIDISNIFRTNWRSTETTILTPFYSQKGSAFGNYSRQRISFTLSYTFGYGKKVKQGNELGTASGGQSSIL